MTPDVPLGPGGEFDVIRRLLARWGPVAAGIGDDAAVLDVPAGERLVASTDCAVEGVHFRRDWLTPREIGWRATAAALSDLAAMAAEPLGMLVALQVSESWLADLDALADGIGEAARSAGARLVGGDLSAARELAVTCTVLGHARSPLTRAGAASGDALWVTGRLGGPAAALRSWKSGVAPTRAARERFAFPEPRLRAARWLADNGAHAAIDISDGLLGDAGHLAAASGVRLELELDALPRLSGVTPEEAAASGEEYELLVAAPPGLDAAAFACAFALPLTRVGRVEGGPPQVHALLGGHRVASSGGFSHFS